MSKHLRMNVIEAVRPLWIQIKVELYSRFTPKLAQMTKVMATWWLWLFIAVLQCKPVCHLLLILRPPGCLVPNSGCPRPALLLVSSSIICLFCAVLCMNPSCFRLHPWLIIIPGLSVSSYRPCPHLPLQPSHSESRLIVITHSLLSSHFSSIPWVCLLYFSTIFCRLPPERAIPHLL